MTRWFNRLERFQFDVQYKKGKDLALADGMSRSTGFQGEKSVNMLEIDEKIMKMNENMNQRKNIQNALKTEKIIVSMNKLRSILEKRQIV